jgi:2-polyprenyl-3-methyl-5-hydroxy-6-metoxy-1,4-benzoquinol methylase
VIALASRRPDRPGRDALALYRDGGRAARLHTLVRWWSAPFPAIEQALPPVGRILEIGCGHGLFSTYAALSAPGRIVHGVDIDPDKIRAAKAAGRHLPDQVTFDVAPSGDVPDGPWDAIVIIDVLYLLPAEEQRRLLLAAATQVAPGGVLVVKEMSPEPHWKARWNSAQETIAVKLLRITEGGSFDFVPPGEISGWLRGLGATVRNEPLDSGRAHPHHLIAATMPKRSGDTSNGLRDDA